MIIFAYLTFINLQKTIVQLNCNRELTTMTLIQVIFIVIATIPFITRYIYSLNIQSINIEHDATDRFINTIINYMYYTIYVVSFNCEFKRNYLHF